MSWDDEKDTDSFEDAGSLLGDLDGLPGEEGLGTDIPAGDHGMPKKVELDIDDLSWEDDEEEPEVDSGPIVEPEPEPAPPVEEKEEEPPKKFSMFKLAIIGGATLVVIVALLAGYMFLFQDKEEPPPQTAAKPGMVELRPFVINYPAQDHEIIILLSLALRFPDEATRTAFDARKPLVRDLIFRVVQGYDPNDLTAAGSREKIQEVLGQLVNQEMFRPDEGQGALPPGEEIKVEVLGLSTV